MNVSTTTIETTNSIGIRNTPRKSLAWVKLLTMGGPPPSVIKFPEITKTVAVRVYRVARAVRSAVRQSFVARNATKAANSGGESSDPDGRRPHTETYTRSPHSPVSAFLFGGAK